MQVVLFIEPEELAIVSPDTNLKLSAVLYPVAAAAMGAEPEHSVPTLGLALSFRFMPNCLLPGELVVADDIAVMVSVPEASVEPKTETTMPFEALVSTVKV